MAYDKVVDSSVLDAGLKAIADAIREKGGTSDNLAFPDAMAAAIAAIEAGCGTETVEVNVSPIKVTVAVYYMNANSEVATATIAENVPTVINVMKNSVLGVYLTNNYFDATNNKSSSRTTCGTFVACDNYMGIVEVTNAGVLYIDGD